MLRVALLHANGAVLLDNKFHFEGATQSYLEACTLLSQVEERSAIDEDRNSLKAIVSYPNTPENSHNTDGSKRSVYRIRIKELENYCKAFGR